MNIASIYRRAGIEIKNMLLNQNIETMNAVKADKIRSQTRRIVAGLHIASEKWANEDLMKSYNLGERKAKIALQVLGMKPKRPALISQKQVLKERVMSYFIIANRSIIDTVNKFIDILLLSSSETFKAQIQEFDFTEIAEDIAELARQAVIDRISRQALTGQILSYLRNLLEDSQFIEINGKYYNPGKYSKMVARTELRKAQTEGTLAKAKEYEADLIEISDHSCDCDICEQFEGNIYSISGSNPNYEPLGETPPYHPNCKHSILPTSEEAIEIREKYQ